MRAIATVIVLAVLLQACGSKGALYLPSEKSDEQQPSSSKQK
jgi:predicted small lipoprotein YifL